MLVSKKTIFPSLYATVPYPIPVPLKSPLCECSQVKDPEPDKQAKYLQRKLCTICAFLSLYFIHTFRFSLSKRLIVSEIQKWIKSCPPPFQRLPAPYQGFEHCWVQHFDMVP